MKRALVTPQGTPSKTQQGKKSRSGNEVQKLPLPGSRVQAKYEVQSQSRSTHSEWYTGMVLDDDWSEERCLVAYDDWKTKTLAVEESWIELVEDTAADGEDIASQLAKNIDKRQQEQCDYKRVMQDKDQELAEVQARLQEKDYEIANLQELQKNMEEMQQQDTSGVRELDQGLADSNKERQFLKLQGKTKLAGLKIKREEMEAAIKLTDIELESKKEEPDYLWNKWKEEDGLNFKTYFGATFTSNRTCV